jgi:hypothetical protein
LTSKTFITSYRFEAELIKPPVSPLDGVFLDRHGSNGVLSDRGRLSTCNAVRRTSEALSAGRRSLRNEPKHKRRTNSSGATVLLPGESSVHYQHIKHVETRHLKEIIELISVSFYTDMTN